MSGGFYHTVTRRTPLGWVAIRMCDDIEVARTTGKTHDEAKARLVLECLPERLQTKLVETVIKRNSPRD